MATANSKTLNAITFINMNELIAKLTNLDHDDIYKVVDIVPNKSKFNFRVITIQKGGDDTPFKVYMPEYVAKYAKPEMKFIYEGLQKKEG